MELKKLIGRYQDATNSIYRNVNIMMKEKIHSDITTDQFSTLQYIQQHEKCTSTEIAQTFGVGKSAVTAQITRLYEKGLIKRVRDQKDRRNVYLYVTEKGIDLITYTEKEIYAEIGKYLGHFEEEEITTFIHSLEKLAAIMEREDTSL
ncbi:MarR family winged helix-turn-helix transcriptional regulator [Virgibacillus siamensis]|uniref:MarR family winged helix-turn-helix transcriptional regulator n=1 Tax=Virgibacillus siamensis TaxID=480071 RepID=UPI000986E778|nr:SMC-Scp complex subunit ScpB [Virgibacillus siamensis]